MMNQESHNVIVLTALELLQSPYYNLLIFVGIIYTKRHQRSRRQRCVTLFSQTMKSNEATTSKKRRNSPKQTKTIRKKKMFLHNSRYDLFTDHYCDCMDNQQNRNRSILLTVQFTSSSFAPHSRWTTIMAKWFNLMHIRALKLNHFIFTQ